MKRYGTKTVILGSLLVLVILSGCVTLPDQSSENRCMLVINRTKKGEFKAYAKYHLYMDGSDTPLLSFSASNSYLFIENLEPGEHHIDRITVTTVHSSKEDWTLADSSFDFVLKEGYITILDKTFATEMVRQNVTGNTIWYMELTKLRPVSADDVNTLVKEFNLLNPDNPWRL